jgi:hypothetical protein
VARSELRRIPFNFYLTFVAFCQETIRVSSG